MSAINSSSDDRDFEAIRRAQRAHEPSMEEILASIRNIIADEREAVKSAASKAAPQRAAPPPSGPQIVYSKDDSPPERLASETAQQRAESFGPSDANTPKVVWRQSRLTDSQSAAEPSHRNEESLLSPEANEAVISSFEALSANLALRSAELADGLVREMLRPMLKQWLDDNLPAMVERLVRAEIERVARGG